MGGERVNLLYWILVGAIAGALAQLLAAAVYRLLSQRSITGES